MNSILSSVIPIPPVLPVGFRFNPSDEELIGYYLKMLLLGLYSDDMPIGMTDFLEFEPWELPGRSRMKSDDQVWYFFCRRFVYLDRKKRMYKRKTGTGHWSPTGESTIIGDVGKRSTLRFYKDSPKQKTEWIAYEYEIKQSSILSNPKEFVIIKLMKSSGEKRTKKKTNTRKQHLKNSFSPTYEGNSSDLDEVTTASGCRHEAFANSGNQDVAESIQKDTESKRTATISYEHQNPTERSFMSTNDIAESSSGATSGCRKHSSVTEFQENESFPAAVLPLILENEDENEQSNGMLASDFEEQNPKDGDLWNLMELDPEVLTELTAYNELLNSLNSTE